MTTVANLARGRIILALLYDQMGRNPKRRPAVILTATDQINATDPFVVAAISSELGQSPQEYCVPLPWHPKRHSKTGLTRRCAAICTWLCQITAAQVLQNIGFVPATELRLIGEAVAAHQASRAGGPSTNS